MRLFQFAVLSAGFASLCSGVEVTKISGKVTFDGKPITRGYVVKESGEISTGPASTAVVLLTDVDGRSELALAPETRVRIEPETKPHSLLAGSVRARLRDKVNKARFSLKTTSSTMAVRGTDFLAAFNPLLGDSEIVVFEGNVGFTSAADAADTKDVSKGYWGGVGGRFGKKIGDLIQLPPHALKHFDEASTF